MSEIASYSEEDLENKIDEFLDYAGDLPVAAEIQKLVEENQYDVLENIISGRVKFDTGGLCCKMGAGFAALNDVTIIQISQGMAAYLEATICDEETENETETGANVINPQVNEISPKYDAQFKDAELINRKKKEGVVIGFDNRHSSERFAELVAIAFISKGFKVNFFPKMTPTPFVPFAVKKLACLLGVMVTASHNPKEYNGMKVYGSNGVQISSLQVENIRKYISKNLCPWPQAINTSLVLSSPLVFDPFSYIELLYYDELETILNAHVSKLPLDSVSVVFTALHGVSHGYMKKAFQRLNFQNYFPVQEQMVPDARFPTVEHPNPERRESLELGIKAAEEQECNLIFSLDTGADRFRVIEKIDNGKWYFFTGNEIAALLGSWLWDTVDENGRSNPTNCCMVSSTVSSKILRSIAEKEGFKHFETFPGSNCISQKLHDCIGDKMNILFAFEECFGYTCGDMILEKDGIHTAARMLEMASYARGQGKLLYDFLDYIYRKYGYHYNYSSVLVAEDSDEIYSMFSGLRNFKGISNKYPQTLERDSETYNIIGIRDVTTGYDSTKDSKNNDLSPKKDTEMITFYFDNNSEITLRRSDAEPEVKYYGEIVGEVAKEEWENLKNVLHKMLNLVVSEWIQPQKYHFRKV